MFRNHQTRWDKCPKKLFKIQGEWYMHFLFTNLLSAGKDIAKYRTSSSFFFWLGIILLEKWLLQINSCHQLKPQKADCVWLRCRARGVLIPTFERATYSLAGFSSMISFCRVLPLILFIPHIHTLSHQDAVQITAIQSRFWFFFKSLPRTSAGAQLIVTTERRVLKGG